MFDNDGYCKLESCGNWKRGRGVHARELVHLGKKQLRMWKKQQQDWNTGKEMKDINVEQARY